jgi:signal transduction histidine kinase
MHFYKYILFGFAVTYLIHILSSLSHMRGENRKLALANIGMSFFTILSCLVSFNAIEFGANVVGIYKIVFFDTAILSGGAAFYFYLTGIHHYLGVENRKLAIIKKLALLTIIPFLVDILYIFIAEKSFLAKLMSVKGLNIFTAFVDMNIEPFPWTALILVTLNLLLMISCFLIWRMLEKKEVWLKLGIVFSVLAAVNDSLMPSPIGKYLLPLYFLSNAIEAARFAYIIRVNAYEKIGHLESEVQRLSKAAEISYIAGSISHDIANPLMVIMGNILRLKKENNPEVLEKTHKAAKKIQKIINTYLNLMRINPDDQKKEANLKSLVNESIESCENRIHVSKAKVEVSEALDRVIRCNETKIELVLNNLISNACDAIKGQDDPWVRLDFKEVESAGELIICDSGKGIADDMLDKIFQKQFTTKSYSEGTGLGLDMVKQLLDQHKFNIRIDKNNPNTCFIISIPKSSIV